jgi:hypothetical protein
MPPESAPAGGSGREPTPTPAPEAHEQAWTEALADEHAHQRPRLVWVLVAVLAVAGIAAALAISTGRSSRGAALPGASTAVATHPATVVGVTTIPPPPPPPPPAAPRQPVLSPVTVVFDPVQRETTYSVTAKASGQGTPAYSWTLKPPPDNAACTKFAPVPGSPSKAVWHHADTDGCLHVGVQHAGWIYATITTADWVCTQSFFGTLSRTATSAERCQRR